MAQNFVQERSDALTRCIANKVAEYREETPPRVTESGYRPTKTLTHEDKQRMRWNKAHPTVVPWYDLTQGEEMKVFTLPTKGARLWKRMGTKARIFLRSADLASLTTVHKMYTQRRDDDLADTLKKLLPSGSKVVTFSTPQESGAAMAEGTSSRRSSARRSSSDVNNWSKEFGYGLPLARQTHAPYVAISDPETLKKLGVNMKTVGDLPLKGRWALSVHECHHPMGALRQAGTKPLTDGPN